MSQKGHPQILGAVLCSLEDGTCLNLLPAAESLCAVFQLACLASRGKAACRQ